MHHLVFRAACPVQVTCLGQCICGSFLVCVCVLRCLRTEHFRSHGFGTSHTCLRRPPIGAAPPTSPPPTPLAQLRRTHGRLRRPHGRRRRLDQEADALRPGAVFVHIWAEPSATPERRTHASKATKPLASSTASRYSRTKCRHWKGKSSSSCVMDPTASRNRKWWRPPRKCNPKMRSSLLAPRHDVAAPKLAVGAWHHCAGHVPRASAG